MSVHEDDGVGDAQLPSDDFEGLIMHPDRMKDYLRKLRDACASYRVKFKQRVQESKSRCSERAKQLEKSSGTIAQLTSQKKELREALDVVRLEQKVVEKKTINTIREIEKCKAEIEATKETRETLTLEIVDLQQEKEKSKEYILKQWDAVKRACYRYKNALDIHIDTEIIDSVENVTVTFFLAENPLDKKFFVILLYQNDCWKVKKIEPELSVEQKYQLNHVVQFSKQSEVSNVTSLLCKLRRLFLKNYFEN